MPGKKGMMLNALEQKHHLLIVHINGGLWVLDAAIMKTLVLNAASTLIEHYLNVDAQCSILSKIYLLF